MANGAPLTPPRKPRCGALPSGAGVAAMRLENQAVASGAGAKVVHHVPPAGASAADAVVRCAPGAGRAAGICDVLDPEPGCPAGRRHDSETGADID